jgi:hypothetical protein
VTSSPSHSENRRADGVHLVREGNREFSGSCLWVNHEQAPQDVNEDHKKVLAGQRRKVLQIVFRLCTQLDAIEIGGAVATSEENREHRNEQPLHAATIPLHIHLPSSLRSHAEIR